MNTVSAAYIMGIKEGRKLLQSNPDFTREDIQVIISNIKSTLRGFSGDVAEILRGERDFWINQLKQKD
jgi:hypothetical protein